MKNINIITNFNEFINEADIPYYPDGVNEILKIVPTDKILFYNTSFKPSYIKYLNDILENEKFKKINIIVPYLNTDDIKDVNFDNYNILIFENFFKGKLSVVKGLWFYINQPRKCTVILTGNVRDITNEKTKEKLLIINN